jgi:hypothetical protein
MISSGYSLLLLGNCQPFYNEICLALRILRDQQRLDVLFISHVTIFSVQHLKEAYYKLFVKRMYNVCICLKYILSSQSCRPESGVFLQPTDEHFCKELAEDLTNEYHHTLVKVSVCMCQRRRTINDI